MKKRALRLLVRFVVAFPSLSFAQANIEVFRDSAIGAVSPYLFSSGDEMNKDLSRNGIAAPDLPSIKKWMYDENYMPSQWLGSDLDGKTIWEPINVIFMDGFAVSSADARDRMRDALSQANFTIRTIHSTDYKGMIGSIWYEQEPTESIAAFSDAHCLLDNNHGRMFGSHYKEGVYYYAGAFSRESGIFHNYISFNIAKNTLANNLDSLTAFKKGELIWLDNRYNTSTDTTGDHNGFAFAAQDTFETNDTFLYANRDK